MVTDTIGDFISRIRNAQMRSKKYVTIPSSKMLLDISKILKEEDFIEDFVEEYTGENSTRKEIKIKLKYKDNKPAIQKLVRVSKPGVRVYVGYREIPKVISGYGIAILTTPKGVISGENARKIKVGGELLCKVW